MATLVVVLLLFSMGIPKFEGRRLPREEWTCLFLCDTVPDCNSYCLSKSYWRGLCKKEAFGASVCCCSTLTGGS
ncbi:hypothetical protein P8452_01169 [Trifolium repens]|nr:hypothetical protein P8452_01169 [Trifolium repens]